MKILVHHDGQQLGPYSLEEARAALGAGTLSPGDLAWQEGTPTWVPLASLLAGAVPGAPPSFPGAAPQTAIVPANSQTSGLAITSLVLGILALPCFSIFTGIPAVICGHIARSKIRRAGGLQQGAGLALAGLILGYVSIAMVPITAALVLPAVAGAQRKATEVQSMNQARQIVLACSSYANAHGGAFPDTLQELVPEYLPDQSSLTCPMLQQPGTIGYLYYGGTQSDAPDKVLLVSKATGGQGRRIVGRVSGDVRAERYEPLGGAK